MAKKPTTILHLVPIIIGRKKPERKRKNLIRLGVEKGMAYAWNERNEPEG